VHFFMQSFAYAVITLCILTYYFCATHLFLTYYLLSIL